MSLKIEKSRSDLKITESQIKEFYKNALELEPKMLINYLVKEIVLYDDRVIIKFNNPSSISPDESRGFSFYKKVTTIPANRVGKSKLTYIPFTITVTL